MSYEDPSVAFLGLGAMGSRMARRLLDAGHRVVVWNRTPSRAETLVEAGAERAASPAAAVERADVVLTMLADPAALQAVSERADGFASSLRRNASVIEMSTVGPEAVRRLRAQLPATVGLLDAPVLGSLSEAENAELQIFVGGPAGLVSRWTPLLAILGHPIHVGPLGAGAAAKLVANTTLLGTLGVLGEAVALGRGLGLGDTALFDVLAVTPLAAQAERRRPVLTGEEPPRRFALSLGRKDAELIADAAGRAGVRAPVVEAVHDWLVAADEAGLGDADYSTLLRHIAPLLRSTTSTRTASGLADPAQAADQGVAAAQEE